MMQDQVYRLWKITVRSLKNLERLSCGLYSKEANYQLAIKNRRRAHKRRRVCEYEYTRRTERKKKKIFNSETSRYRRALAKYRRAKSNLDNFVFAASDVTEDYIDNFCVEFDFRRNQINIYFGGYNRPKGRNHGHCGLDCYTLRPKFPTRYPGQPHPRKTKKQKYYESYEGLDSLVYVIAD